MDIICTSAGPYVPSYKVTQQPPAPSHKTEHKASCLPHCSAPSSGAKSDVQTWTDTCHSRHTQMFIQTHTRVYMNTHIPLAFLLPVQRYIHRIIEMLHWNSSGNPNRGYTGVLQLLKAAELNPKLTLTFWSSQKVSPFLIWPPNAPYCCMQWYVENVRCHCWARTSSWF